MFFKGRVTFLGWVFDGIIKTTKRASVDQISKLKPCDVHSLSWDQLDV